MGKSFYGFSKFILVILVFVFLISVQQLQGSKDLQNKLINKYETAFDNDMKSIDDAQTEAKKKQLQEEKAKKAAAKAQQNEKYVIVTGSLNVRSGPSQNYQKIGLLHKGDKVKLLSTEYKPWISVEYASGKEGYVYDKYVKYQ